MWWWILLAAILIFAAVLVVRALAFKPADLKKPEITEAPIDCEHAVESLRQMVRCKTVSYRDWSRVDESEFEKFRAYLQERYPNIHSTCTREQIGGTGLLYHWKGKEEGDPTVLMAHYDVVPADEESWEKPAFEGIIENDVLWGRGTLDTKGTLNGVVEAAEQLIGEGFVPQKDVYFAFAGDEEIAGDGASAIVDELEKRGIHPAMVVDEGGAVVEGVFPGVNQPCALIGTGEKGMMDVKFTVRSKGGHASSPPPHTPLGEVAKAVVDVENHPFPAKICAPVAEMFDTLGRRSTFLYRMIFANLWCFKPVLNALCKKKGGELNALMRTTCAFTMSSGSKASNVLPPEASACANMRLIGGDNIEGVTQYLKNTINNPDVEITLIHGQEPCAFSETKGPAWEKLTNAVSQTWPEALVSPYLMIACSDSRHYCRISNHVYRFSAMALTTEERGLIHGHNERIPLEKIGRTVQFYYRLIKQC